MKITTLFKKVTSVLRSKRRRISLRHDNDAIINHHTTATPSLTTLQEADEASLPPSSSTSRHVGSAALEPSPLSIYLDTSIYDSSHPRSPISFYPERFVAVRSSQSPIINTSAKRPRRYHNNDSSSVRDSTSSFFPRHLNATPNFQNSSTAVTYATSPLYSASTRSFYPPTAEPSYNLSDASSIVAPAGSERSLNDFEDESPPSHTSVSVYDSATLEPPGLERRRQIHQPSARYGYRTAAVLNEDALLALLRDVNNIAQNISNGEAEPSNEIREQAPLGPLPTVRQRPWSVPISIRYLEIIKIQNPIDVEKLFSIVFVCSNLQELTVSLCEIDRSSSSNYAHWQRRSIVGSRSLVNLFITTAVEPSEFLPVLMLPKLKNLHIEWDPEYESQKFPRNSRIGLQTCLEQSACLLDSLSLCNILPEEMELTNVLRSQRNLQRIVLHSDIEMSPTLSPFVGRMITNVILDTLGYAYLPKLADLELSDCYCDDGFLSNMIEARSETVNLPLQIRYSYLLPEQRHRGDERKILALCNDRWWLSALAGPTWPVNLF